MMCKSLGFTLLLAVLFMFAASGIAVGQTDTSTATTPIAAVATTITSPSVWPDWCPNCYAVKMVLPGVMDSMKMAIDKTGDVVILDPLTFTWLRNSKTHYMGAEEQFYASGYWYIEPGVKFDAKRYKEFAEAYQARLAKSAEFITGLKAPDSPANVLAVANGNKVTVSFSVPTSAGKTPVTFTASLGSVTKSSASSPITFNSLSNGIYFVTLTANNKFGVSEPVRSNKVQIDTTPPPATSTKPAATAESGTAGPTGGGQDTGQSGEGLPPEWREGDRKLPNHLFLHADGSFYCDPKYQVQIVPTSMGLIRSRCINASNPNAAKQQRKIAEDELSAKKTRILTIGSFLLFIALFVSYKYCPR
jgi:hypothetical protein